jgi:CubicO group peptidase (beta-lactamase class C family)
MNIAKRIDEYLDALPGFGIPGCDFAVAKDGEIVYRHAAGYADHAGTRAVSERDLYRVFSVSKVTACVCGMRLLEAGLIHLDDPVSKYIPAYAKLTVRQADGSVVPAERVMTIRHLFTMTGGLDYNMNTETIVRAAALPGANTVSVLAALAEAPLRFEPGTHFLYSLCHDVLAAVVEVVSGERYSEYVRKNITEPLGMTDTGFRPTEEQRTRLVEGYRFVHGLMTAEPIDVEKRYEAFVLCDGYDSGGAGLFSSVNDQMKLLSTLACGGTSPDGYRLLSQKSIERMGKNELADSARPDFMSGRLYGYSWGLCGRAHVNKRISRARSAEGEFGWDGAAGAFALADPINRVSMYFGMEVLGCNYSYHKLFPDLRDLGYELLGIE